MPGAAEFHPSEITRAVGQKPARRPRVLVVDDAADNRELVVQLLEDWYDVSEAVDGRDAIACIQADRPDLVLLDLMMPDIDGFGVLRWLRETGGPFLPVVVLSAASEREPRMKALKLGAHEFLGKPVDREELVVRAGTLLELKSMREEREQALEAQVNDRTRELQNALARLEATDRYKDEFLSVISHELRTPLNFIMGFASILQEGVSGELSGGQIGHVDKILAGADRMLRLVDDLLDFARIQAGTVDVSIEPVDYGSLVNGVVSTLRPLAAHKGLLIDTLLEVDGPVVLDGARITQVLTNLIGNAIKYSDHGTILVRAQVEGNTLVTHVEDHGEGIADDDMARLFQRFGQLDTSLTRRAGGAGLGLAISKGLVERHGGTIGVHSQPGVGSIFSFQLPEAYHEPWHSAEENESSARKARRET